MIIDWVCGAVQPQYTQLPMTAWNWIGVDTGVRATKYTAFSTVVLLLDRGDKIGMTVRNIDTGCVLSAEETYLMIRKA